MYVSGKLPTYPSPNLTITLTSRFKMLGWGGVGEQFPRNIHCSNILSKHHLMFYLFSYQVDAMLLRFVPRVTPLIDAPFIVVEQIVKANFSERRKTIRSSLR